MIPRHLLPFDLAEFASQAFAFGSGPNAVDVEQAYARALGAREVLLFPSVRAAIHILIRAACGPDASVVCPAYTCDVVHQALTLAQARTRLLDSAPGSFLMSPQAIGRAVPRDGVLLLSEVYGIPYDLDELDNACQVGCRLRIFDLAMRIPSPERVRRLSTGDAVLYSFGWGKPLYAGWGGIACFQDAELADQTRRTRDKWLPAKSTQTRLLHGARVLMRVFLNQRLPNYLLHERHLYAAWRRLRMGLPANAGNFGSSRPTGELSATDASYASSHLQPEWFAPTSCLNRRLALWNLQRSADHAELRRNQAETYWRLLVDPGIISGPAMAALPESHFPLRVSSELRDGLRAHLNDHGIDASTLFELPGGLSRAEFPRAARASDEVLTLPLGPRISAGEVNMIAAAVKNGLRALRH